MREYEKQGITLSECVSIHKWLRSKYGKATKECYFCNCKSKKRYEWALKKGFKYERNIDNFISLCASCHRKYDETDERRKKISLSKTGECMGSKNPASRKVIDTLTGKIFDTVIDAAKSVGLKRTTLLVMLRGQNPNKTTLKYYTPK